MKKDSAKKSTKWLWILIAIVALLAAAAAALVCIFAPWEEAGNQNTEGGTTPSVLYWNLDRIKYTQESETGLSTREPDENGLYTLRFVSEGQLIEGKTADKQLVYYMDAMAAFGLTFDESGLIIDVVDVQQIGLRAEDEVFVKRVEDTAVSVNTSVAMNGLDMTFAITAATRVIDARPDSETLGQPADIEIMDQLYVYANQNGEAADIFLVERLQTSPLYLRMDSAYDSTLQMSTRKADENGVFTIPFTLQGQLQQLKCKDREVLNQIDAGSGASQVMGLTFDEEGYINGVLAAASAIRGKLVCNAYNITAINGNSIEATRLLKGSEQGKKATFTITENTQIVMNEDGCGYAIGQPVDSLVDYDRVFVWTDVDNNAQYILVAQRKVTDENVYMYFLKQRKYDSTNQVTTRVPDEKGYYVFQLAAQGKQVTAKTKDKALATKLDANSLSYFGLRVEKGIIKEYYAPYCLSGGYGIGGTRYITDAMGSVVRIVSGSDFSNGGNYMLTTETEVYDVTGYSGKYGSVTTLQPGDRVVAQRDVELNLTHVYVLDRPITGAKIYYNSSRQFTSTTMETTRTPDAEGYYVYTMYCEGKQVEVKTKDKSLANIIDEQNRPIVALKVNKNNIVTKAGPAIAALEYSAKTYNGSYVERINSDNSISCYYYSSGVKTPNGASYKLAKDCKVYNVSANYSDHCGEKATLKVGDRIQALRDLRTNQVTHIWIVSRMIDSPLYINHTPQKTTVDGAIVTTRTPDADGYYSVELFVDGKLKTFRTKDMALMSKIDSNSAESPFAMKTSGDIILVVDEANTTKRAANTRVAFQDVMKISGKTITTERMRPGQSNTGATVEFTYTSKTKIYDVSYYSENRFQEAKLKKGDRISVYADADGNITYIFIFYPQMREEGYLSKCPHCNKKVWWEPYNGSFVHTADNVHYYLPNHYTFNNQGTVGRSQQDYPDALRYTAIFDLNGKTMGSKTRNFLVYSNLILIDTVGGGALEANGYNGGSGGNFLISGGSVEVNDGITIRKADNPNATSSGGGNFNVSRKIVKDKNGKTTTYIGSVTINDAVLEGWDCPGGTFYLNTESVLNLNGGVIKNSELVLRGDAKLNWKAGKIESDLVLDGCTLALSGTPDFTGVLSNTNGGKVDISKLSTEASIKVIPSGVFTTESDNIDAYLNVFISAAPDAFTIVKEGKALTSDPVIPALTDNLAFIPGTQMAACAYCKAMVTWTPITQEAYGETAFGSVSGLHVYLAEDIVYTGSDVFVLAPGSNASTNTPYEGCFHLNGHNITAANAGVIRGGTGIVNVLGNGVVSGNGADSATVFVSTNKDIGCVYLHSGTYIREGDNHNGVIRIDNGGGKIVIGKDAVVETAADTVAAFVGKCSLTNSELQICGTVKGGYIQTVDADPAKGFTSTFVLDGGTVEGGIKLAATNVIRLSGAAKVGEKGMDLTSGAKIQASALSGDAAVTVKADGIFTADIDAAGQKGFYQPVEGYNAIEVIGNTLSTSEAAVVPPTPEEPVLDYTANLEFISENVAYCPVCEKAVEWTPINQGVSSAVVFNDGQHYYLAEDITYTNDADVFMKAPGSTSSKTYKGCFHLNGHNLTATAASVFRGGTGILNVMGSGTVSGNGSDGAAAYVSTNKDTGCLYLYSGTYVRAEGNQSGVIQINNGGGRIIVGKDAVVETAADTLAIYVGKCSLTNSDLQIYGTVKGGYIQTVDADPAKGFTSTFVLDGGSVEGGIKLAATNIIKLSGAAKVGANGLDLTSGAKIQESALSGDAAVTVKADGVFTAQIDAAGQKGFYQPAEGYNAIEVIGNTLSTSVATDVPPAPEESAVDYKANLEFTSGNTAHCPVCDKDVVWTAITQAAYGNTKFGSVSNGQHVYLAEDIVYTDTAAFVNAPGSNSATNTPYVGCFHLNGHTLTSNQATVFQGGTGVLNIMGSGTVISGKNEAKNGAAVAINTKGIHGAVNLYSGTYTKTAAAVNSAVIALCGNGGKINIHKDVTIIGIDDTASIYVGKAGLTAAEMTIDGATIQNGSIKTEKPVKNTSSSSVTEFGGISKVTLTGVELVAVELAKDVQLTLNGDIKIGKLDVAEGAKFAVGELGSNAKIAIAGNGVVSEVIADIAIHFAKFTPFSGTLKVENGVLVASR